MATAPEGARDKGVGTARFNAAEGVEGGRRKNTTPNPTVHRKVESTRAHHHSRVSPCVFEELEGPQAKA